MRFGWAVSGGRHFLDLLIVWRGSETRRHVKRQIGNAVLDLKIFRMQDEVDGKWRDMTFLANNFDWSATTIAELYRARWEVELLFRELKQPLQRPGFARAQTPKIWYNSRKWEIRHF